MPLSSVAEARAFVENRSVAVVCNAPEILDTDYGCEIDKFDIVLRMNRAFPTKANRHAIGVRTDILTGGLIHPLDSVTCIPNWIFWFKHTPLGDQHLADIERDKRFEFTQKLHVPAEWLAPLWQEFGAGPSSGPAAIRTLQMLGADQIEVFGLSCWGKLEPGVPRHWWDYPADFKRLAKLKPHDITNEAIWLGLRTRKLGPLHYEVVA